MKLRISSQKLYIYLFVLIYWFVFMNIISVISILFTKAFLDQVSFDSSFLDDPIISYWISPAQFLESSLFAVFFSLLYIVVNELAEKWRWDRLSFGKVILLKSGVYLIGLFLIVIAIYYIITHVGTLPRGAWDKINWSWEILLGFSSVLLYGISLLFILNFMVQSIQKMGNYNLISFLSGKYHNPVNEDRIFIFIDLTSSTAYAEKLGNTRYSKLIKDCFDDLNYIVNRYNAEIYQYVGDEIVLTWKKDEGLENVNFVRIFFAFQNELNKRSDYYMKNYGVLPEFKAGINGGLVSVAEVGNIKRDIAFHGDVVNTTSRIQGVCKQLGKKLLVSNTLAKYIEGQNGYAIEYLGEHLLRGKNEKVGLYSIEEN